MPFTLLDFVRKWNVNLHTGRGYAQDHFRDTWRSLYHFRLLLALVD